MSYRNSLRWFLVLLVQNGVQMLVDTLVNTIKVEKIGRKILYENIKPKNI